MQSSIFARIKALEENYKVDEWVIEGIHIWPIIRIRLYFKCLYEQNHNRDRQQPKKIRAVFKSYIRFIRAVVKEKMNTNIDRRIINTLFLSNGVSYCATKDGRYFDKFCDPFVEMFNEGEITSEILIPLREYYSPRFSKSSFIQPYLDYSKLFSYYCYLKSSSKKFICWYELEKMLREINNQWGLSKSYTMNDILKDIFYIRAAANTFKRMLKKRNPTLAFSVCYYSNSALAFNIACRELAIPTVDIQHGVQFDTHIAYGHWTKLPKEGYGALPTYFWCWTEDEARVINNWNKNHRQYHQPMVGGNLWLEHCRLKTPDWLHVDTKKINSIKTKQAGKLNILLTLQPLFASPEELKILIECIHRSRSDWMWWIRLHPLMLDKKEQYHSLFETIHQKDKHVDIDICSDVNLYDLLPFMNVHITHSSAVLLEAIEFEVPSIIYSEAGKELFERKIDKKQIYYFPNSKNILSYLENIDFKKPKKNIVTPKKSTIKAQMIRNFFLDVSSER